MIGRIYVDNALILKVGNVKFTHRASITMLLPFVTIEIAAKAILLQQFVVIVYITVFIIEIQYYTNFIEICGLGFEYILPCYTRLTK